MLAAALHLLLALGVPVSLFCGGGVWRCRVMAFASGGALPKRIMKVRRAGWEGWSRFWGFFLWQGAFFSCCVRGRAARMGWRGFQRRVRAQMPCEHAARPRERLRVGLGAALE